jgi:hypothetical protein
MPESYAQNSQSHLATHTHSHKIVPQCQTLCQSWVGAVSARILWQWNLLYPGRLGSPISTPFAVWDLSELNFSVSLGQTLSLSTTPSHYSCLSLWHYGRVSQDFPSHGYSLNFKSPESSVSNSALQQMPVAYRQLLRLCIPLAQYSVSVVIFR